MESKIAGFSMRQAAAFVTLLIAAAFLAGCTHDRSGDPRKHYASFNVAPPQGQAVEVCRAYTCKVKTTYYFHKSDIAELAAIMRKTKRADTPFEERRAVAYAISRIEIKVAAKLGLKDRAGMEYGGSGDLTQQDCVDEATNTTSYLLVLQSNKLLKHHTVEIPFSKGDLLKGALQGDPIKYWPHWTAVIQETKTGQKYAVDSWIYENGENPAVVKVEDWYIKDLASLPKSTY
ncbi:MAG TPA: hypothetical protein VJK06_09410 [Methyloceanibacter sp.]|nr:hypothetical protein [Methyloceanibacter sp.]